MTGHVPRQSERFLVNTRIRENLEGSSMWAVYLLVVLLGIMGAVIYAAFQREPHNRPAYFPGRIPGRRVTVCAGDSLTAATWSTD